MKGADTTFYCSLTSVMLGSPCACVSPIGNEALDSKLRL